MNDHVIFFFWRRSLPGREQVSGLHFQEFVQFLGGAQGQGLISSFEPVFLDSHGGAVEGFFLIRGGMAGLGQLMMSDDWIRHMARAGLHLDGSGAVHGVMGDELAKRMEMWMSLHAD